MSLTELSLRAWRVVANARGGARATQVREKLGIDADPAADALNSLKRMGYVVYEGEPRFGVYKVTLDTRIPKGEAQPEWLLESDDGEPSKDAASLPDLPVARVSSVFHLGGVNIDNVHHVMAEHEPSVADAAPTAAPPKEPSSDEDTRATRSTRLPRLLAAMAPEGESIWRVQLAALTGMPPKTFAKALYSAISQGYVVRDGEMISLTPKGALKRSGAATKQGAPLVQPASLEASETQDFVCSINSNGELFISDGLSAVNLQVAHTRRLLHFLDHVCGSELAGGAS